MRHSFLACAILSLGVLPLLIGCGSSLPPGPLAPTQAVTFSGHVHGGEQPVSGSVIQLYTVGTTGDGSAATPLIGGTVQTDSNGNFSITGLYTCTGATDVYLVATGGNPGLGGVNPNLALMTALGPCASLTPQTFISVNELTTVAAVYALSPFMSSLNHLGSSSADVAAMHAAFGLADQLVSSSTGAVQPSTANFTVPVYQLDLLADILAACVNSTGGTAGDSSICGNLFGLTASASGTPPADTIAAVLDIAAHPTANVASLYNLIPAAAPYQPTPGSTPPDLALQQTSSANTASGLKIGPSSLIFPPTNLGIVAPSQTVEISNPTLAQVALTGFSFTGANGADFAQTNTCGSTLAPFTTCTAVITFTPGNSSMRSASLTIASATPDSPQLVALAGTGTNNVVNGPRAVVSSPVVHIYPGASYDVTLSNTGNAPLGISSIALGSTPFNTQTNNCPSSLDPGASCTITLRSLAPGADQLTILTNDASFPPEIPVYQAANSPNAIFTPSNLFFADTAIGSNSTYNYTYKANAVLAPAISGAQASEFSTTTPVCTPGQYPTSGPNCTFTVRFTPTASGLRLARLAVDASGNYLPLAGMGTTSTQNSGPSLYIPTFAYFPVARPTSYFNSGNSPAAVPSFGIQSMAGYSEFTETNDCGTSLAPNSSCTINIASSRLQEGGTQALFTITTGGKTSTQLLDNSLTQVINFGDTSYTNSSTGQHASYPVPDAFNGNYYSSVFGGSIAQYPWTSFSFDSCSVNSGTCVGEFNFSPTQPGAQTGNASVLNNGNSYFNSGISSNVRNFILVGNGVAVEPAAKLLMQQSGFLSLPGAPVLNQGTLTLINMGAHTLTITTPALSGSSPQSFALGQASCVQPSTATSTYPSIAQGALCTIPVAFTGTQTGLSAATVTVTDTTSGLTFSTPLYLNTLAGPTLSPSALSFPDTGIYAVSPPQSVTVTRDATHPVTTVTTGGLIAIKGSCAAGETPCILTFAFAPTSFDDSPTATVYDAVLGTYSNLPLNGTPVGIVVYSSERVSTRALSFLNQAVGTSSLSQPITLTSGGPNALNLYSMQISGTIADDFTQTNNCPASLAVNATCTINATFTPTAAGYEAATLTIKDSANPGRPLTISLAGAAH